MKNSLLITVIIISLWGCKKNESPLASQQHPFTHIFVSFWEQMDQKYIYWDVDKTNWDAVYETYSPLFQVLNIDSQEDVRKSISYFREITSNLTDGHFSIQFKHPFIKDSVLIPAFDKMRQQPDFHDRYDYSLIIKPLLSNYVEGIDNSTINNRNIYTLTGKLPGDILYFTCNSFYLSRLYYSSMGNSQVKAAINYFLSNIRSIAARPRGIIIDLRGNMGGEIVDINLMLQDLIAEPLHFGYSRTKTGMGRVDFSPWLRAEISPQSSMSYNRPVIILVDNYSASLSETILFASKELVKASSVGEKTYGATGPVSDTAIFLTGPFEVNGFMSVTISSTAFMSADGNRYEGIGIIPDHIVKFDRSALQAGIDPALQKAISLID